MFTGIVEAQARVAALETLGTRVRVVLEVPQALLEGVSVGDSVAVNGACLTVTELGPERLCFEAVPETMQRTSLGDLAEGSSVNVERALRAGARLDGHIVQGHVDATGRVKELRREGDDVRLFVACAPDFAELLVEKGSVAIDGVSLTVVDVHADAFDVALIPHTLEVTTLGRLETGSRVNLEADVLGKYVKRYLERVVGPPRTDA